MDFMFGLLTGIFGIVVAFALFVVHVLKVNLDLPASKSNGHILNQHSYLNGSILRQEGEGSTRPVSRESTPGPDFTDISETRLRSMIQKIITETIDMPPLSKTYAVSEIALDRPSKLIENGGLANGHRHRTEHYFEPTIYQDLLATAVLNKIVDKQSVNNRTISESSPDLTRDIVDGVDLDQNYNNENNSVTSGSSIEPRSDCSYTDTEPNITTNDDKSSSVLHTGRESVMSDYLAGHMVPLPDLSNIGGESEEDDYMSVTSSAIGDSTWENNWLFKKKKLSGLGTGSVSTSSIGMLVPDPKEDVRAQIGDKTADEISDLSELGSDTDDSSMDLLRTTVEPINDRLFNKHLIGGQNSKMVLDELIERSSMISNTLPMDQEDAYAETRNMNVEAPSQNEAINTKVNHQNMSTITNNNNNHEDQKNLEVPTDAEEKDSNPLAGSIAEREYKKWYNAVEMPNNPYAPEALKRRISGSQERFIDLPNINKTSEQCPLEMITKEKLENNEADKRESEYRRYSRDYYINDGSKSSQASSTSPVRETPKDVTEVKMQINNHNNKNKTTNDHSKEIFENHTSSATNQKMNTNDCNWTISTPVRRASSLKYLNYNLTTPSPPSSFRTSPSTGNRHNNSYHLHHNHHHHRLSLGRPATSASNYRNDHYSNYRRGYESNGDLSDNYEDDMNNSWTSSSALNSRRRTLSMLSVFSGNSSSGRCSTTTRSRSQQQQQPDSGVLTQFEKTLLHKDLKRNSFRAVSATTKDFVMNPLFEKQQLFNGEGGLKLSIAKPLDKNGDCQPKHQLDDQGGDSGVDSCLNGFSEKAGAGKISLDGKFINDNLIF